MPRRAVILGAAVFAVAALAWYVPYLTEKRDVVAATPGTQPFFEPIAPIGLEPHGGRACAQPVTIGPEAQVARFRIGTHGRPGPRLRLELSGSGYRYARDVPAGYGDAELLSVPVSPPPRTLATRACFVNLGARDAAIFGTAENRTSSLPATTVDGVTRQQPDIALAFFERERRSILARVPESLERMATFRPGLLGPWFSWTLAVLALLGVPGGVLWALGRSLQTERDEPNTATSWSALPTSRG
jgi:hypothetical protein